LRAERIASAPREAREREQGWLEAEHGNLRAALQWAFEHDIDVALRIIASLWPLWYRGGSFREAWHWFEQVLNRVGRTVRVEDTETWAAVLGGAGDCARNFGNYAQARPLLEQSLAIYRKVGNKLEIARGLNRLGFLAGDENNYLLECSLYEECLVLRRELGDTAGISNVLSNLGEAKQCLGDYSAARLLYEESLVVARESGIKTFIIQPLHNLGLIELHQGNYQPAFALFTESLLVSSELRARRDIAKTLAGLAGVAGATGQSGRAARLFGAADALFEAIGTNMDTVDLLAYDRHLPYARARLDEAAWQAAWDEGRAMTTEQAIEYALSDGKR